MIRIDRSADPVWWGLAGLLGLASLYLPAYFRPQADHQIQLLMAECGLFFSGALVGALRPRRVWRWGAAALVAFVLSDLLRELAGTPLASHTVLGYAAATWQAGVAVAANMIRYIVYSIPVLTGAYIGSNLCGR